MVERLKLKGYYIYYATDIGLLGVDKKVENQTKVFQRYFDFEKIVVKKEKPSLLRSVSWRLPLGSYGRDYDEAFDIINNPDFIYIRFVPVDRRFLGFIKELKRRYPKARLIMEVATYPYGQELLGNFSMLPFYFKDVWYRRGLKQYIDRIVTFSDDKEIFGIPTIQTMNGIVVDEQKVVCDSKEDDVIRLLAVAMFQKSHGYERIIKGLAEYYRDYGKRKVELHMVGEGSELGFYKKQVRKYHLEEYVFFYGRRNGVELDHIYNCADIGLAMFGLYKRKINRISSLKMVEYLAKGLPVVTGCYEDILDRGGTPYLRLFPNDKSVINVNRIIEFYDLIYVSHKEISRSVIHDKIRDYARKTVDMMIVMRPIIAGINSLCGENTKLNGERI